MKPYLEDLIRKLRKIIKLKQEENFYIFDYIDSLSIDITGSMLTYSSLANNNRYITVLNIINYLSKNEVDFKKCKREVFKAVDEVEKIIGDSHD